VIRRGAWVTDVKHLLDSAGQVPPRPKPIVAFMGSIVTESCMLPPGDSHSLGVSCRRRPARRPCTGRIHSQIDIRSGEIRWHCPMCSDHGYISHWERSPWDLRPSQHTLPPAQASDFPQFTAAAARAWERVPHEIRIRLLNNVWCGACRGNASIAVASAFVEGCNLVLEGSCTKCGGSVARVVEEVAGEQR